MLKDNEIVAKQCAGFSTRLAHERFCLTVATRRGSQLIRKSLSFGKRVSCSSDHAFSRVGARYCMMD